MAVDWKEVVLSQFGASIEMLANAVGACPDDLWAGAAAKPLSDAAPFWYVALHAVYFLDLYLGESEESCVPPPPLARQEADPGASPLARAYGARLAAWAELDGLRLPARPFTKDEVLGYLALARSRCRETIAAMSDAEAAAPCGFPWLGISRAELLLYNMRHVQHHAAQLNLLLRQNTDSAPGWVACVAPR